MRLTYLLSAGAGPGGRLGIRDSEKEREGRHRLFPGNIEQLGKPAVLTNGGIAAATVDADSSPTVAVAAKSKRFLGYA